MTVTAPRCATVKGAFGARASSTLRDETPSATLSVTTAQRLRTSPAASQVR